MAYTVESYFSQGYTFSNDVDGETIARYIRLIGRGPRWLDLGCGPSLPIWAIFNPDANHIIGADLNREAIAFLRKEIKARRITQPLRAAADYAARSFMARGSLSPVLGKLLAG